MLAPRIDQLLSKLRAQHLLRKRNDIDEKKSMLNFCSNDYLNLSTHPDVIKAYIRGAEQYGLGSGASAVVSGYTSAHYELEEAFAQFLQRDQALLFNSGYHANLGVLTTFANRHTIVVADKLCHASLIDGIVLSRAKHKRYHHNNYKHAEDLLRTYPDEKKETEKLLVTESVFSIEGDIANVKQLASIAKNHHAMLIVDDAHGIGVLGTSGAGICDRDHLSQSDLPCLITPFGKAIGSFGAIVSGKTEIIEALLQCSRTHRYSTALPPAVCSATFAALKVMTHETWRREKLHDLIAFFLQEARARNLFLLSTDATPIKSIVIGANEAALEIQKKLAQDGYRVSCIRPPTVKTNQACLRISLSAAHTKKQITHLLDLLVKHHECKN